MKDITQREALILSTMIADTQERFGIGTPLHEELQSLVERGYARERIGMLMTESGLVKTIEYIATDRGRLALRLHRGAE